MPSPDDFAYLARTHEANRAYNQAERSDYRQLADLGHPDAAAYNKLRAFFDTLRYACNASARYFTYDDANERSQYWAPTLGLTWEPDEPLQHFQNIHPDDDRWNGYIKAAAVVAFNGAYPRINTGNWYIETKNPNFIAALTDLSKNPADPFKLVPQPYKQGRIIFDISAASLDRHERIIEVISRFHEILPSRTEQDDIDDIAAIPLTEKQFMLCDVEKVTIQPKLVLVPPTGPNQDKTLTIVEDLTELFVRGFPFKPAAGWLKSVLAPKAFNSLKARFGAR